MSQLTKRILIVDDESSIREMIALALDVAGYETLEAENAQKAHALILDQQPDLVLLDWMMPGTTGITLAKRLRADPVTQQLPIIMLTAKSDEDNLIQGLNAGVDDYLSKPFSPRELVARLKAVLRRCSAHTENQSLSVSGLTLDLASQRVFNDQNQQIELGPTEFRLLQFFMSHPERAYSRGQLLDSVWGGNVYVEERTVDVHIRRLRKALDKPFEAYIQTVRGTGYRFSVNLKEN